MFLLFWGDWFNLNSKNEIQNFGTRISTGIILIC
jgi:hypothetical protein